MKVGLDIQVHFLEIALEGVFRQQVDGAPDNVGKVLDVLIAHPGIGKVDADDDIGPHFLGYLHREVVAHSAIGQNHIAGADGGEEGGDGHCGTEGGVDAAAVPHLGLARHHIGSHAGEGDGEFKEVGGICVPGGHTGDNVSHVLAVDQSGGKASAYVPACDGGCVAGCSIVAFLILLVLEVERKGQDVTVAIADAPEGQVFAGYFVGKGDVPVHGTYHRVQVRGSVAHSIEAAHEASDAGSYHKVHRNVVLLDKLHCADVRGALGSAAAEYQRHGGPAKADGVHPHAKFSHGDRIRGIQAESGGSPLLRAQRGGNEEYGGYD